VTGRRPVGSDTPGDRIELRGLRLMGICGALPEEQVRPQPLAVDIDVIADLAPAGRSDALEDTMDYGAICATVERIVTMERFTLLERLAQRLAEELLLDERATAVTLSVRKLRPPVPQPLDTSGVSITRTRTP
jgi:FolB domain-containing protein